MDNNQSELIDMTLSSFDITKMEMMNRYDLVFGWPLMST